MGQLLEDSLLLETNRNGTKSDYLELQGQIKALHKTEENKPQVSSTNNGCCYLPKRYILVILLFLGFVLFYVSKTVLGIAIVPMTTNRTIISHNATNVVPADFDWDLELQGLLFSLTFYGGIIAQIPFGILAGKYGGKLFFGGGLFIVTIMQLLTPVVSKWNLYAFILLRIIQGFAEATIYPSAMVLLSNWLPATEVTKLTSIVLSGQDFGAVVTFQVGGLLAACPAGWPSMFYFFGGCGLLWYLLWLILITNKPEDQPWISKDELQFITTENTKNDKQIGKVPWISILTSGPVWAISIGFFVENWCQFTWEAELPTYMDNIFHTRIEHIGFLLSLPYLALAISAVLGGLCANAVQNRFSISTGTLRKMFSSGAYLLQAVFIVAAYYAPTSLLFTILITLAVGFGGISLSGVGVNVLDISPEYAGVIVGINNAIGTIPGVISPALTGYLLLQGGIEQWKTVFYLAAGINLFGAVMYGLLASGEKQKWSTIKKT